MTDWTRSQCGYDDKPDAIDTTSSPTTVYIRRNFEEITVPAMEEGESETRMWQYDERTYSKEEYAMIQATTEAVNESVNFKHDNDVIDDYTMTLIEEGLL